MPGTMMLAKQVIMRIARSAAATAALALALVASYQISVPEGHKDCGEVEGDEPVRAFPP